jgi:hypothetical protein
MSGNPRANGVIQIFCVRPRCANSGFGIAPIASMGWRRILCAFVGRPTAEPANINACDRRDAHYHHNHSAGHQHNGSHSHVGEGRYLLSGQSRDGDGDSVGDDAAEVAAKWLGRSLDAFYGVHLVALAILWATAADDREAGCARELQRVLLLIVTAEAISIAESFVGILAATIDCCRERVDAMPPGCLQQLANARMGCVLFAMAFFCMWPLTIHGPTCHGTSLWQAAIAFPLAIGAAAFLLVLIIAAQELHATWHTPEPDLDIHPPPRYNGPDC